MVFLTLVLCLLLFIACVQLDCINKNLIYLAKKSDETRYVKVLPPDPPKAQKAEEKMVFRFHAVQS